MCRRLCLLLFLMGCPKPLTTSAPPPSPPAPVDDPVALANPRMGTGGWGFNHGSAFPGAAAPNGMVKAGPDTRGEFGTINFLHYSGYYDRDDTIMGFSQMHLHGAGATDYGIISVMPSTTTVGMTAPDMTETWSTFSKSTEIAEPGYYSVQLDKNQVKTEITASTRVALYRFTFPSGTSTGTVMLDLDRTLNGGTITGARIEHHDGGAFERQALTGWVDHVGGMSGGFGGYRLYFAIEARTRMTTTCWKDGSDPLPLTELQGTGLGCAIGFDLLQGEAGLAMGLSYVHDGSARQAIFDDSEGAGTPRDYPDFDQTRAATRAAWDGILSRIRISGGTEEQQRTFYSSLHHGFMMPTITSDPGGQYVGHDRQVHVADGFNYVTDLSLWDTYRTLHPLYSLIAPDRALDVIQSLLAMAQQGGAFPKWPIATGEAGTMIGSSAEIVVADSYVKGLRGFDAEAAYAIMRAAAMDRVAPAGGRGGRADIDEYLDLGFVPAGASRAPVSMTLEYAHNDFALGNLARALGHDADADALLQRRKGYAHLWDAQTGFLRMHNADGSLAATDGFDPTVWDDDEFAEANAWQSLFGVPHDVEGLVALFGSREAAVTKLEEMFDKSKEEFDSLDPENIVVYHGIRPYYFHGNEPDLHDAFMFSQLGRRDLMAKWVHWARTTFHNSGPDGLAGNDDGGTLGAWYVFAALGFYPLAGSDQYIVGTPLFPRAELKIGEGIFTIEAENAGGDNIYVQRVELNGRELAENQFAHSEIRAGGTMKFVMGPAPR